MQAELTSRDRDVLLALISWADDNQHDQVDGFDWYGEILEATPAEVASARAALAAVRPAPGDVLDMIHGVLDGREWSSDTAPAVAELLTAAGYTIRDPHVTYTQDEKDAFGVTDDHLHFPLDKDGNPLAWPDPDAPAWYVDAWNGIYDSRAFALAESKDWGTATEDERVLAFGETTVDEMEVERRREISGGPVPSASAHGAPTRALTATVRILLDPRVLGPDVHGELADAAASDYLSVVLSEDQSATVLDWGYVRRQERPSSPVWDVIELDRDGYEEGDFLQA